MTTTGIMVGEGKKERARGREGEDEEKRESKGQRETN